MRYRLGWAVSRSALPRERFSPVTHLGPVAMSALAPLLPDKRTSTFQCRALIASNIRLNVKLRTIDTPVKMPRDLLFVF